MVWRAPHTTPPNSVKTNPSKILDSFSTSQGWVIAQRHLPARLNDLLNAPILRLAIGSIEKLGLKRAAKGPRQMIEQDGRVPLLDIGTVAKIREVAIRVRGAIEGFIAESVAFVETGIEPFDAVILATGFRPDLRKLLRDAEAYWTPAAGRSRATSRRRSRVSTSAARSPHRRRSCARSTSARHASPNSPDAS